MWSMSCITSLETHRKDQKAVAFGWKRLWLLWTKWSLWKGESIGIFHDRAASSFSLLPYGQQTAKSRGSGTQNCVQNVQTIQILQGSPRTLTCSAAQCILSLRIHDHESFVSSPRDLRLGRFVTHPSLKGNLDLRPQDAKGCQAPFSAPCKPWPTSVPGLKFSLGELLVLLSILDKRPPCNQRKTIWKNDHVPAHPVIVDFIDLGCMVLWCSESRAACLVDSLDCMKSETATSKSMSPT